MTTSNSQNENMSFEEWTEFENFDQYLLFLNYESITRGTLTGLLKLEDVTQPQFLFNILNSGIFPMGSNAGLVNKFAAASL